MLHSATSRGSSEQESTRAYLLDPSTLYLGLEHIERGGRIIGHNTVGGAAIASTKFVFTADHVLFGKLRPNLGKVARPSFAGVCSTDILPIRPGDSLDRNYLAHFLSQPAVVEFAASRATGANLPRLSPTVLAGFEVPLPALDEQRRIAMILDCAGSIRVKLRQAVNALDTLVESNFHTLLSSERWPTVELAETVSSDVTYGIVQAGPEYTGGVPYIRTGDITGGQIDTANLRRTDPKIAARFSRSMVRTGDIVISIRATVGTTAIVTESIDGANLTQGTARIAPGELTTGPYLLGYLRSQRAQRWIQAQVKGATFREITLGRLRELPVPLPPYALQREYSERADYINVQRRAKFHQIDAADELFASLQSRAFRGEL